MVTYFVIRYKAGSNRITQNTIKVKTNDVENQKRILFGHYGNQIRVAN